MKEEFDLLVLDSNALTETKINLTENDVLFLYRCQKNVCRRLDWVECDPQKLFLIINRFLESGYVHPQNYRQVLKTVINVYYDIRSRITNKVTDEDIVEAMTNLSSFPAWGSKGSSIVWKFISVWRNKNV